jgi:hypothetical protein
MPRHSRSTPLFSDPPPPPPEVPAGSFRWRAGTCAGGCCAVDVRRCGQDGGRGGRGREARGRWESGGGIRLLRARLSWDDSGGRFRGAIPGVIPGGVGGLGTAGFRRVFRAIGVYRRSSAVAGGCCGSGLQDAGDGVAESGHGGFVHAGDADAAGVDDVDGVFFAELLDLLGGESAEGEHAALSGDEGEVA